MPIEMVHIPSGSFLMGNTGNEDWTELDELPQHSVNLTDYYICKHEVTRGQYNQFILDDGYSNQSLWSASGWSWKVTNSKTQPLYWEASQDWGTGTFTQTDNHPVVGVSYYEAEAFCNWAGGQLPTEQEWEKAARWNGSSPRQYPWGDIWDAEKCNNYFDSNSAGGGYQKRQTSIVGSYTSGVSHYGCEDMAGNVAEWCKDWYVSYPGSSTPFDYTNTYRVLRGGSWNYVGYNYGYRCSFRIFEQPQNSLNTNGFRIRMAYDSGYIGIIDGIPNIILPGETPPMVYSERKTYIFDGSLHGGVLIQ